MFAPDRFRRESEKVSWHFETLFEQCILGGRCPVGRDLITQCCTFLFTSSSLSSSQIWLMSESNNIVHYRSLINVGRRRYVTSLLICSVFIAELSSLYCCLLSKIFGPMWHVLHVQFFICLPFRHSFVTIFRHASVSSSFPCQHTSYLS